MVDRRAILDVLQSHTKVLSELLPATVEEHEGHLEPVTFLRNWVWPSKPLVVRNDECVASWPALSKSLWRDQEYLNRALRDTKVTVALTPDGLADAPMDGFFMLPAESTMPYSRFVQMLERQSPVVYLQKQNNSFVDEFSALAADVGRIAWADCAFGAANLDAINFWQGAWPTKTSWHRDPYENMYVVLRGTKRVRLLPLTDAYRMRVKQYRQARWKYENGRFVSHQLEGESVAWSSLPPCTCARAADTADKTDTARCVSCAHLADHPPKEVLLNAGDVLYIPAWTYHELSHDSDQLGDTIAVNFWYDTQYGQHGFATMQTFDRLAELCAVTASGN